MASNDKMIEQADAEAIGGSKETPGVLDVLTAWFRRAGGVIVQDDQRTRVELQRGNEDGARWAVNARAVAEHDEARVKKARVRVKVDSPDRLVRVRLKLDYDR